MSEPRSRPHLLFDVMSTLVHDPFHVEMPAFFGMSFEELMASKHPDAWQRFETGELDEGEFLASFFRDGRPFDHDGFREVVAGAYRWLEGMQELMQEMAARGHRVHALSNYPNWYRLIEERLGLSRVLAWSFVSCEMGVRKPDPRAFRIPAQRLGAEPADCLFVDDQERNCTAAAEEGMQVILFRDATSLRSELAQRSLLE